MKKISILILCFVALAGCEKSGDLNFSEAIQGGCFLDKGGSTKKSPTFDGDTVTYTITGDNLGIFLGFNATCCGEYASSSKINGDSILIEVTTTQIGMCNCICYYTYNFKFTGNGKNYKYKITVDDYLTFTGEIKP
jgi:hypothetical protein